MSEFGDAVTGASTIDDATMARKVSHRCAPDDGALCAFGASYSAYHGYIGTAVCAVGFVMNLLNAIILSRRPLMCPTNAILISISAADMITIAVFAPYLVIVFFTPDEVLRTSKSAAEYVVFFAHASLVSHTASVWLTVTLAAFRCLCVLVRHGSRYCTYSHVWPAVAAVAIASFVLDAPQYAYLHVAQSESGTWYVSSQSVATGERDRALLGVEMWIVAVLGKTGPCVILALFSFLLMRAMAAAKAKVEKWNGGSGRRKAGSSRGGRRTQRTTAMLVAVVVIFGAVEFPKALLLLTSQILGEQFMTDVYVHLADLFDLFTIINSSVNFVIYCTMSRQFRKVVRSLALQLLSGATARRLIEEPAVETVSTSRGPAGGGTALPTTG